MRKLLLGVAILMGMSVLFLYLLQSDRIGYGFTPLRIQSTDSGAYISPQCREEILAVGAKTKPLRDSLDIINSQISSIALAHAYSAPAGTYDDVPGLTAGERTKLHALEHQQLVINDEIDNIRNSVTCDD